MADGHLNKCRECTKRDVRVYYRGTHEKRSEYEKQRYQTPDRKAAVAANLVRHRRRNPEKTKARAAVAYALRTGKITRRPCEFCGTRVRVEAHHVDYSRPLDVRWICFVCHRENGHGQLVSERMRADVRRDGTDG
jgi:hypothetical protein